MVVAEVAQGSTEPDHDGAEWIVVTKYHALVLETFKGPPEASSLEIRTVGGELDESFPDGPWPRAYRRHHAPRLQGGAYLLALEQLLDGAWTPTGIDAVLAMPAQEHPEKDLVEGLLEVVRESKELVP